MITAVSYGYSSFTGTFSLPGAIGLDAGGFLFPTQDETVKEKKAIAEKKESQDLESRLRPAYDGLALIAARSAEESENIPVSSLNIHSNYLVPLQQQTISFPLYSLASQAIAFDNTDAGYGSSSAAYIVPQQYLADMTYSYQVSANSSLLSERVFHLQYHAPFEYAIKEMDWGLIAYQIYEREVFPQAYLQSASIQMERINPMMDRMQSEPRPEEYITAVQILPETVTASSDHRILALFAKADETLTYSISRLMDPIMPILEQKPYVHPESSFLGTFAPHHVPTLKYTEHQAYQPNMVSDIIIAGDRQPTAISGATISLMTVPSEQLSVDRLMVLQDVQAEENPRSYTQAEKTLNDSQLMNEEPVERYLPIQMKILFPDISTAVLANESDSGLAIFSTDSLMASKALSGPEQMREEFYNQDIEKVISHCEIQTGRYGKKAAELAQKRIPYDYMKERKGDYSIKDLLIDGKAAEGYAHLERVVVTESSQETYLLRVFNEDTGFHELHEIDGNSVYAHIDRQLGSSRTLVWKKQSYIDMDTGEIRSGIYLEMIAEYKNALETAFGGKEDSLKCIIITGNGKEPGNGSIALDSLRLHADVIEINSKAYHAAEYKENAILIAA